ncbi:MAG: hypothetical protein ACRDLB_05985 [Actinomycetota bacterium]
MKDAVLVIAENSLHVTDVVALTIEYSSILVNRYPRNGSLVIH